MENRICKRARFWEFHYDGCNRHVSKAAGDCRTPKSVGRTARPLCTLAYWSAAVLCRFLVRFAGPQDARSRVPRLRPVALWSLGPSFAPVCTTLHHFALVFERSPARISHIVAGSAGFRTCGYQCNHDTLPTWKSAIRQVWKPALLPLPRRHSRGCEICGLAPGGSLRRPP